MDIRLRGQMEAQIQPECCTLNDAPVNYRHAEESGFLSPHNSLYGLAVAITGLSFSSYVPFSFERLG